MRSNLFSWLCPPQCLSCTELLSGSEADLCETCRRMFYVRPRLRLGMPGPLASLWSWGGYEGSLRQLIWMLKYSRQRRVAQWLGDQIVAACPVPEVSWVLPVPLYLRRLRFREFNQSWLLARRLARRWRCPANPGILQRVRDTSSQVGLTLTERRRNVRGAFQLGARYRDDLAGRSVLLVDDVWTTGATLTECARVLKKGGASSVHGLVAARVPQTSSR